MSKTARGKQYTFEDVARLVCKGADPPEGLVRHLRFWARPMEGFSKIELEPPLGRKQMVDALKELSSAADIILGAVARQPMKFVMAPKYPPFDRILLIDLLWDLKRRCHDSIFSPPLSSAKGGVKRGLQDRSPLVNSSPPNEQAWTNRKAGRLFREGTRLH
jgi:hypothetical protein